MLRSRNFNFKALQRRQNIVRITVSVVPVIMLLSYLVELPGALLTVLSLYWILFVPFGIGRLFCRVSLRPITSLAAYIERLNTIGILSLWFLGLLLIILPYIILDFAVVSFNNILNIISASLLIVASSSYYFSQPRRPAFHINDPIWKVIVIALILGVSFAAYIRSFSPYPLTPGFDGFAHMFVIKSILYSNLDTNELLYLPGFHITVALASSAFGTSITELFWTGSFLIFILFSISTYALTYRLTKNHLCAFVATFIGLAVTEMGQVPNLQLFYPSSLLMSIFPLTLVFVDSVWKTARNSDKKVPLVLTGISFFSLLVIHSQLGAIAICILAAYLVLLHLVSKSSLALFVARMASISFAIILFASLWGFANIQLGIENIFGGKMVEIDTSGTLAAKIHQLDKWYTKQVISLSLFGFVVLSLFKDRKAVIIALLSLIVMFVYFQNIQYIYRIMALERPFLSLSAGVLILLPLMIKLAITNRVSIRDRVSQARERSKLGEVFKSISNLGNHIPKLQYIDLDYRLDNRTTKVGIIYILFVIILLAPILIRPYNTYLGEYFNDQNAFVNFTEEELDAANWIEKNTANDYLILSDPFTVAEMKGLSFRENIEGVYWNRTVAENVDSILSNNDAASAFSDFASYFGDKVLIVITPRTSQWTTANDFSDGMPIDRTTYFIQPVIADFEPFQGFKKFFVKEYFELEYQSDNSNVFVFSPVKDGPSD